MNSKDYEMSDYAFKNLSKFCHAVEDVRKAQEARGIVYEHIVQDEGQKKTSDYKSKTKNISSENIARNIRSKHT